MKIIRKISFLIPFITVLIILIFFIHCSGNKTEQKQSDVPIAVQRDSSYLFDGNSLNGWEITNFGPQGPVYVSGGEIILGMGEGCTGITWKKDFPRENYMVTLEAKRVTGNDFFCGITFPVNDDYCSLIVGGWAGSVVGLSCINKKDASENETTLVKHFEKDRWYNICLIVKNDSIQALIDNVTVVNFAIGNKKLSVRPEVELSKPFGITSWTTTAAIRNIRVTKIIN